MSPDDRPPEPETRSGGTRADMSMGPEAVNRIDEALTEDLNDRTRENYYGYPWEYPDCPMPDWLKRRLGLPPDDRLIGEASAAMRAAAMGSRTVPTTDEVRQGLAAGADRSAAFRALSRWIAGRSPHQMMAGWAQGLYTPRQAVAKAIEHGIRMPGLRDQLRCVRARKPAAPGAPAPWSIEPEDATFKLSEPARTLYRRERALIEAWTAAAGLQTGQVALGGGSVLGARWSHRNADDVDIVVQGRTAYTEMLNTRQELNLLAKKHGGTVQWLPEIETVRVTWPNAGLGRYEKVQFLGAAQSPPEHDERTIRLEGRTTRTLGTAQILWKKIERSARAIRANDIFDIRTAGWYDPEALAAAVNAWPATTMRALAQTLRADRAMVGAKIEAEVSSETAIEPGGGPNIAEEASDAIERSLYHQVTIGVQKGLVRIDRTTGTGALEPLRWPPDETKVEGQRTGMARHLSNLQLSVVLDDAARVAAETNATAALWTARDGKTVEWTGAREALHTMRET